MSKHERLVIVGSGPAGYTAALYAARANLQPLLFEGMQPGGQLTITSEVENFPGFPEGILGPELMEKMKKQAERFGTRFEASEITRVDFSQRPFKLWQDDTLYTADAVIVATGASAKWLQIPSEKQYQGRGVSACATCDGFFFRGVEIAVVGGGDTALEEASFLTKYASKVHVVHRRGELRASKIMQDRARKNPKIELVLNAVVDEILGDGKAVTGVRLKDTRDGSTRELPLKGVFMGIGHEPNTGIFKGQLEMNEVGYLAVKAPSTATSVPGVFAAGDVSDPHYRQAISAAGTGCSAAIDAERWLGEHVTESWN
ncbi:thioredoxin reductase [Anaeromyxobacter dehalogenans 2CP-1]|uniref:Thioredoxin reductase n=1 Tax=Anaeromyxobacter dehalogenans (strain ATCC BAA-258 / DSM 21875 / 2CP-1) TaxID=455488 RepID=B8J9M4_ANAD2|nr:thioredoxin-disulfide reductase [Anaeromyxobacter dehalogenans]ACL67412.1 thioredoxin reductase [Anaeromyxobacter dehalogenans 2CP-1]